MEDTTQFHNLLKSKLIEWLQLEDMKPEDINDDEPLFGDGQGLGLDSLDAVEIVIALKREFGIPSEFENKREVFRTLATLADFVQANKK